MTEEKKDYANTQDRSHAIELATNILKWDGVRKDAAHKIKIAKGELYIIAEQTGHLDTETLSAIIKTRKGSEKYDVMKTDAVQRDLTGLLAMLPAAILDIGAELDDGATFGDVELANELLRDALNEFAAGLASITLALLDARTTSKGSSYIDVKKKKKQED